MESNIVLTHWGRVMHIFVGNLTIIDSDNGLSPCRCQAIIWTNAGILSIWPFGTNFSEILIEILISSSKKMHLKVLSAKCGPFCLGLNVLICANKNIVVICTNQDVIFIYISWVAKQRGKQTSKYYLRKCIIRLSLPYYCPCMTGTTGFWWIVLTRVP